MTATDSFGPAIEIIRKYQVATPAAPQSEDFSILLDVDNFILKSWHEHSEIWKRADMAFDFAPMLLLDQRRRERKGWIEGIMSLSMVPIFQIAFHTTSVPKFGAQVVTPEAVIEHYLVNVSGHRRATLNEVSRALHTWRKSQHIDLFITLFDSLKQREVSEEIMPLMLSALTETYLMADQVPQRSAFRDWLKTHASDALGAERARHIFERLL